MGMTPRTDPNIPLTDEQRALVESAIPNVLKAIKSDPIISKVARRYDSFDDSFQVAIVGICRAAQLFDPGRGMKFWTYAWWHMRSSLCRFGPGVTAEMIVAKALNGSDGFVKSLRRVDGRKIIPSLPSRCEDLSEAIDIETMKDRLECRMKENLTALERDVLLSRMEGETFRRIANRTGWSKTRIQQVYVKALRGIGLKVNRTARYQHRCQLVAA